MPRRLFYVIAVCIFSCAASVLILNTNLPADDTTPPDEVVIKSELWKNPKYQPVKFAHKKHVQDYKIRCTECHHVYEKGKNVWKEGDKVKKCDACHTCIKIGKDLRETTPEEKKLSLHNAYHGKGGNCMGCHQKFNKEKATKKAPVKCTACHAALPK